MQEPIKKRRITWIELSILIPVAIMIWLASWTWESLQTDRQVEAAAKSMLQVQTAAGEWLRQAAFEQPINLEAARQSALSNAASTPWGEPVQLLARGQSSLAVHLCAPSDELASSLAIVLEHAPPYPSKCIDLPVRRQRP